MSGFNFYIQDEWQNDVTKGLTKIHFVVSNMNFLFSFHCNCLCIRCRIRIIYTGCTCIWVRILNDVQLAIFRPWALLLHLVRPQLLRNHFFWCRRKEYKQGFQETYTLYTFTHFCTHHTGLQMQKNDKKWCFYTFSCFRNHPVNFQATLPILSNYSVNLVCLGPVS